MNKLKEMFSLNLLKGTIEGYGFHYSLKSYFLSLGLMFLIIGATGLFYNVKLSYIAVLGILVLVLMPTIIRSQFRYVYEQKRFSDIVAYMEQMIYSFQKQPKILIALQDVSTVIDGRLKELIDEAIFYINDGKAVSNIYEEALMKIENEYRCTRLISLHRLLIQVENYGGEYSSGLNVLLQDLQNWTQRTYMFQSNRKNIKSKFSITILLSFIIASISVFLKGHMDITQSMIYQICTLSFLALCIVSYVIVQIFITSSWLENKKDNDDIIKDYNRALYSDLREERKKGLPVYIIFFVCTIVLFRINIVLALILAVVTIYMPFVPYIHKKSSRNRTIKEIKNSFSDWLTSVAINLQYQTVQVAISSSIPNSPVVLKAPLETLVNELDENPSSVEPYYNFLKPFNILEINSTVKMLYSLTEHGSEHMVENINALIERNNNLIDKTEKDLSEDKITIMSVILYIPMVFASIKLLIDLVIFITSFMIN